MQFFYMHNFLYSIISYGRSLYFFIIIITVNLSQNQNIYLNKLRRSRSLLSLLTGSSWRETLSLFRKFVIFLRSDSFCWGVGQYQGIFSSFSLLVKNVKLNKNLWIYLIPLIGSLCAWNCFTLFMLDCQYLTKPL
jgi:hypothetical protein